MTANPIKASPKLTLCIRHQNAPILRHFCGEVG